MVSNLYSSQLEHLARPNTALCPKQCMTPPRKTLQKQTSPQIIVPRSKLSLISAVYLL